MHLLSVLLGVVGLVTVSASQDLRDLYHWNDVRRGRQGPEIFGTFNEVDTEEMHQAIQCIADNICNRRAIPKQGKVRCTIGTSVAYICNYRDKRHFDHGDLPCSADEMYEAWRQIRIAKGTETGWWYDKPYHQTMGFDKRCKHNQCDNGWEFSNKAEQCTNINTGSFDNPWTFDYEAPVYLNYTGVYAQRMPTPGDPMEPLYFAPWYEGKRPGKPQIPQEGAWKA
ncbi:hypothetical protein QBC46DRAFT_439876 [Diplogelasinospora grovesii]|uniref:Uncharacterized protein n=1 Tax=Diplogelasinospora grovesii TaxID=303347 RepID=A0AAN6S2F3_9PEZI|nr:hypothetical protein QBC46DRAFT_439876 [Diplogelasinospora grovesii]